MAGAMGICRFGLVVGSVGGWVGALGVALWGGLGEHETPVMMVLLSVALFTSGALAMRCYQRPLGDAYELGYERGRRDAIRDANRRALSPIRREPRSLGEFSARAKRLERV